MKRLLVSTLAALMAVGPIAASGAAAQDWRHDRGDNRDRDRDGDRDRDWGRDRDRHDNGRHNGDRRGNRWDDRRHNGYSYNGRWYYGPPPAQYYGRVDYGYHNWRRGDRLPSYYRSRYREVDYRYYHLRPPPRGYHYVRSDNGEVLLVALATGIILSAILNSDRY